MSNLGSTSMSYWLPRNIFSYYIYFLLALPVHNLVISLLQIPFSTSGLTSLDCYMSHIKNLKKYFAFLVQSNLDEELYSSQNVMHVKAKSQDTKFFYITISSLYITFSEQSKVSIAEVSLLIQNHSWAPQYRHQSF